MRPSYLQGLTARKSGAEAIERRGRRVVVGHVGPVAQPVPNPSPVDDAAGPNLADDHDPLARSNDPHGAIPGGGPGALPDDIRGAIRMAYRHRRSLWRKHHRPGRRAHEMDVAACLGRALAVPQIVRPVVLFNDRIARAIHCHDVRDMATRPGTVLSAVPDGHRANGWMGIDDVADRCGGRVPRSAIPEERRLAVRALQGRSM